MGIVNWSIYNRPYFVVRYASDDRSRAGLKNVHMKRKMGDIYIFNGAWMMQN